MLNDAKSHYMQVRYLQIAKKSQSYNPYRWVRYVTQANSYVARLWEGLGYISLGWDFRSSQDMILAKSFSVGLYGFRPCFVRTSSICYKIVNEELCDVLHCSINLLPIIHILSWQLLWECYGTLYLRFSRLIICSTEVKTDEQLLQHWCLSPAVFKLNICY